MAVKLQDGPLAGHEVPERHGCHSVVYPAVAGDGQHFTSHHYTTDGRWLHSETYVGYESDESIAESEALWDAMYWESLEAGANESFV